MGNNVIFGGNWNNGTDSGSRASNWNNSPSSSNNNIGSRGVCDDESQADVLCHGFGLAGRLQVLWSAVLSCFGKHLWGSDIAPSSRKANGAVGFDHA